MSGGVGTRCWRGKRWRCCKWIMLSMYWIAGRKGTRRRRRRSRFEVIAVNQLSCGAGDSLSEGMRDAQIAIGAPTLVQRDDFQPPSSDCSTGESSSTAALFIPKQYQSHKKLTKVLRLASGNLESKLVELRARLYPCPYQSD